MSASYWTIDWTRYKFTRNPPSTYRGAQPVGVYLPVESGHSTLIKVSSMRSAGWGNRSITRTSALSTLLGADRPSPNSKNPLRSYVYPSTKHPVQTLRSLLPIDLPEDISRGRSSSSGFFENTLPPGNTLPIGYCQEYVPRGMARVQVVIHRLVEEPRLPVCS